MKKVLLLILLATVLVLTSCTRTDYLKYDVTINGYELYEYDKFNETIMCDTLVPYELFMRDGDNSYSGPQFTDCGHTLYVKDNGSFITLTEAIENDLFTAQDVLDIDWSFKVFETHRFVDYLALDYLVFTVEGQEDILFDNNTELVRLLENADSFYQSFLIDYEPLMSNPILGYIEVYSSSGLEVTLTVFECGIYDPLMESFQLVENSEVHAAFLSQIGN